MHVSVLGDRGRAGARGGRRAARRRDRRAPGREHRADARAPRARRRAARHRPGARLRPRPSTNAASPAGTSSTATSASTCSAGCPPMDAALIDGDHNWYTVYNELRLLREVARDAGAPLPVMILHDVGWPYGRRDLYYAPETIPEEFRQPYAQAGMRPDAQAAHAVRRRASTRPCTTPQVEGGPRNGVMTGARRLHGRARPAAAAASCSRSTSAWPSSRRRSGSPRQPALAAELDRLESAEGQGQLLELAEDIAHPGHGLPAQRVLPARPARPSGSPRRYLDSIKRGLLDEYYLENEVRHRLPRRARRAGHAARHRSAPRSRAARRRSVPPAARAAGAPAPPPTGDTLPVADYAYSPLGRVGLDRLTDCLDTIRDEHVRGDFVDCGVGTRRRRDPAARLPRRPRAARSPGVGRRSLPQRRRRPARRRSGGRPRRRCDPTSTRCATASTASRCSTTRTVFLQGDLDATLARRADRATRAAAHRPGPRRPRHASCSNSCTTKLSPGGVRRDRRSDRSRMCATRSTRSAPTHGIDAPSSKVSVRSGPAGARPNRSASRWSRPRRRDRAGATRRSHRSVSAGSCDLSVVIVVYNMRREAARIAARAVADVPARRR